MNEEYLNQLYQWISSNDRTFTNRYTADAFKAKMVDDKSYAAKMYEWIGGVDNTFTSRYPVDAFMKKIATPEVVAIEEQPVQQVAKKKDIMESPSEGGFSASLRFDKKPFQDSTDNTRLAVNYANKEEVVAQAAIRKEADTKRTLQVKALNEEEAKRKVDVEGVEQMQRSNIWADPNFAAKLNLIDANFVGQNDTEVLPVLRDKFAKYGFIFEQINFDGMGDNIIVKNRDGSKQLKIDLDAWTDAGEIAESKKLRDFIKSYAEMPDEKSVVDDDISKAIRAKQLRKKGRQNADGTVSTVKFESANIDGKEVVYPTLFPRDSNGDYGTTPDWWDELSGMEAYKRAVERGEVFTFNTAEEAQKFAEGSWKDVSNVDAEGQIFFKEKGKDYIQEKKRYDEYIGVRDQIDFIEDLPTKVGMPEDVKKYPNLFINGILRDDSAKVLAELKKKEDQLFNVVMDEKSQILREEWDLELSKRQMEAAKIAVIQNSQAKKSLEDINLQSYKTFGVPPEQLATVKFNTAEEVQMANSIIKSYVDTKSVQQDAADKYEIVKTYYDAKANKTISKEFSDNLAAVQAEITTGYNRGLAQEVILLSSLGIKYDMNDPELKRKAAEEIVKYTGEESETQSRVMSRWTQAMGGKEQWDIIKHDPLEWATALAFGSIAQMFPYGWKIVTSSTLAGIGAGAGAGLAGGPLAEVTVPAAAATGGVYGFRSGMALASLAMEYGNEMIEAITTMGYDIKDPDSVVAALSDEGVWALGKERGLKRGIPIALVDYFSAGTVGKVIKTGSVAGKGARIASNLGERLVIDPAAEALGEAAAQITVGDKLDYKEIIAEAGGGIGNNSSYAAINTLRAVRTKNNVELADKLGNIDFISREISSNKKISDWGNNMQQLGKIDANQNQRIQLNVGLREEARNLLGVGGKSKYSGNVESRTMTLLAAKEELSSTPNRKSVFSNKISEINTELEEIATTKKVRPAESQTLLAGTGVLGVEEQASGTDIRQAAPSYQIGKNKVTKEDFLKAINKMSIDDLRKFNGQVENDDETLQVVIDKLAPLQEQKSKTQTALSEDGKLVLEPVAESTTPAENIVLKDVASTTQALETKVTEGLRFNADFNLPLEEAQNATQVAEAYHNAKQDNSNPELVAKIEELLAPSEEIVSPRTQEEGEFVVQGTFRGDQVIAGNEEYRVKDYRQIGQAGRTELVETIKGDKKIFTLVTPNKDVFGRRGYMGVSLVLPSTTTKTNAEIEAILKTKTEEVNPNIDRRTGQFKNNIDMTYRDSQDDSVAPSLGTEVATSEESQALLSEVSDLETMLSQPEGKVEFRLRRDDEVGPAADEVEAMVRAINALPTANASTTVSSKTQGVTIDTADLATRTTKPPKTVSISVINGIPTIFTISDQLRTGDIVNPNTGNTIDNLMGGLGYSLVEDAAWANTTSKEADVLEAKAMNVYTENKDIFDKWWKANPQYNGLVPMAVVKMGEGSILSNEATFRVLKDNLSKFPEENKQEALGVLKKIMADTIIVNLEKSKEADVKATTKSKLEKSAKGLQQILDKIDVIGATSIDDLLSPDFFKSFTLPTRTMLIKTIGYGQPNEAGQTKKAGKPTSAVAEVLMKNQPKNMNVLINLANITDLITEPAIKNVPQRSVIAIQGVDVLNPSKNKSRHPNYDYNVAGRLIGILDKSIPVQDAFPVAYNAVLKGLVKEESLGATYTAKQVAASKNALTKGQLKPTGIDKVMTATLVVQSGMPGLEFIGALTNGDIDNATKLRSFLNTAFPSVKIYTDTQTFNNVINSDKVKVYLKGDEIIYGVTVDGDIYINPDTHNSESALFNTTIHEMGHVWTDYLKTTEKGTKIFNKGVELAKETDEYQRQLKNFNGNSIKAATETLAVLIGNKGESISDASIKSKFEEWLLGMWKFISESFKMSKDLTNKDIKNLTLDQFIGTALADIFNGQEIKMTDEQLQKLKNPEAAFSTNQSMDSVIQKGRQNGFSDASIKQVLLGRGFSATDVNTAMSPEYVIDLFSSMPNEFGNLEGGILEGRTLFNEVRDALNKWSVAGPRGGVGTVRTKTYSDIRQKGMDLMKANPIFQNQPEQTQKEILNAFDRSLGIRANPNVQREIADIRNDLKQRKIGANNLKSAQIKLKNFIRTNLPKSDTFTQAQINKLVSLISDTNLDKFERNAEKVLKIVEQQRGKMKTQVLKDIYALVDKKSKPAITKTGKRRSSGLDASGQSFFAASKPILSAIIKGDAQAISNIQQSINEINPSTNILIVDEAIQKQLIGEALSVKEQRVLNQALAFDTFSDLNVMELEDVQKVFEDLKVTRAESIARLKSNRALRAADNMAMNAEAETQIKNDFRFLFNPDGTIKNANQLRTDRDKIWQNFQNLKVWSAIKSYVEQFDFMTGTGIADFFRRNIQHLGTYSMTLDKNTDGFFTKNVYQALNIMDENQLKGYYKQVEQLDRMANSIQGNTKGYRGFKENLSDERMTIDGIIDSKTGNTWNQSFGVDQLMRIYSLSKNDIQREKLRNMGFSDEKLQDIKDFIGPEAVQMSDMMIDYFSNVYFDTINDTYRQVNDTNLGYVPNYFPTRTISSFATTELLSNGNFNGIFDSENAPALKERTDKTSDIDLNYGFINVVENHFQSMERYKAYANGVKKLNALMDNPSVNTLLEQVGMKDLYKLSINAAVNPNAGPSATKAQNIADKLANKFTGFALAFKAVQIIKQATSFVSAFEDYSYRTKEKRVRGLDTAIDLAMFMIDYAKVIKNLPSELKKAQDISASFRDRLEKGIAGDVYGLESGRNIIPSQAEKNTRFGKFLRGFKKLGASPTVIGDTLGVLGYMANYNRDIANGMSKAEALERFNNFNSTQQTRRATEKNQLQLQQAWYTRAFTMFGSTVFLQMNKAVQSMGRIMKPILAGKPSEVKSKDLRAFALSYAIANVAFAFAANIMKFTRGNDEDKEQGFAAMRDAMLGLSLIYQLPLFGSAIEKYTKKALNDKTPTKEIVNPLSTPLSKMNKAMNEENPLKVIQPIFEMSIGAQIDPFIGFGEMITGQGDESSFYDFLGISASYRPGYHQKKNAEGKPEKSTKKSRKELFPNNPELWK